MRFSWVLAIGGLVVAAGAVSAAETKVEVEVKNTHLCCNRCVTVVGQILQKVDGVAGKCDRDAGTIAITAKDKESAQKAVDALAAGGFHGTVDSKEVTIKDDSGATKGKVKSLTLTGIHNCCNACNEKINSALGKVKGVSGNTAKSRSDTFDVTGDFDAEEVVKTLNAAGFHVKVKK
jgi:mercuric ion binding protein